MNLNYYFSSKHVRETLVSSSSQYSNYKAGSFSADHIVRMRLYICIQTNKHDSISYCQICSERLVYGK